MSKRLRLAALDIGTTKVCCLIGDVSSKGDFEIVGTGVSPNRGLKYGAVVDIAEVTQAIRSAVASAEEKTNVRVMNCFVNVSGKHLENITNRAVLAISKDQGQIQHKDVATVVDHASRVGISEDRRILHVTPKGFCVEGIPGIRNPVGLRSRLVQVDAHIITAEKRPIENITECLKQADLKFESEGRCVVSSVATSLSALTDEEKEVGVALVDIGGGLTDTAVWKDGYLFHTDVHEVGGGLIAYDVATTLRVPLREAEQLLTDEGLTSRQSQADASSPWSTQDTPTVSEPPSEDDPPTIEDRMIQVASLTSQQPQKISVIKLAGVIEARLMDIFDWLNQQFDDLERKGIGPTTVVLTGGVSQMPGIAQVAERVLGRGVRIARPEAIPGLPPSLLLPAFTTATGLLYFGIGSLQGKTPPTRTSPLIRFLRQTAEMFAEHLEHFL